MDMEKLLIKLYTDESTGMLAVNDIDISQEKKWTKTKMIDCILFI